MTPERDRHEPWRVGVLSSQTGVAVMEATQPRGASLAIEEVNAAGGINGCELSPAVYDPASAYVEGIHTADGSAFVAGCKRRFGADERTNFRVEAACFQVHVFAKALAEVNSMGPDVLRPVALGGEFDAPQGHIAIGGGSNRTSLWARIGTVDAAGWFDSIRESRRTVTPDPYLVSP